MNYFVPVMLFIIFLTANHARANGVFHSSMFEETTVGMSYDLSDFHFEVVESYIQIGAYLKVFYKNELVAIQSTVGMEGNNTVRKYKKYIEDIQVKHPEAKVLFQTKNIHKQKTPEVSRFMILTESK